MSFTDIDGALIAAYQDIGLDLETAYDNMHFNPPRGCHWAQVSVVPATSGPVTGFDMGRDLHTGFMQIDFNVPLNEGTADLRDYAQQVYEHFTAGKGFTRNSQTVLIVRCERTNARRVDDWMRLTMTVFFEAETIRPEI